jgi:hypothetical protein
MKQPITLHVSHPTLPSGRIEGFHLLWAFYVRGFRPEYHCQKCLVGDPAKNFLSSNHASGVEILFDQTDNYRFIYVCGVANGPENARRCTNLHFPLRLEVGARAELTTYNGYRFVAENAVQVPIPDIAERWRGLPDAHARCKNFRFGVEYFGANGYRLESE